MSILDGAVEQHVGPDGRFGMRLQRPLVNVVFAGSVAMRVSGHRVRCGHARHGLPQLHCYFDQGRAL